MTVRTHIHLIAVLPAFLLYVSLFIIFLLIFLALVGWIAPEDALLQVAIQIPAMVSGLAFIIKYMQWRLLEIVVRRDAIVVRSGLIFKRERVYRLMGATIRLLQSPTNRLINCGALTITMVNGSEVRLNYLDHFNDIRALLTT